MTIKELIAKLQSIEDHDRIVIMATDAEGNGFGPLYEVVPSMYKKDSTWSGEIGLEKLTDADRKRGYGEEDVLQGEGCVKAVVLWPIN